MQYAVFTGATPQAAFLSASSALIEANGDLIPAALVLVSDLVGIGEVNTRLVCLDPAEQSNFAVVLTGPKIHVHFDKGIDGFAQALAQEDAKERQSHVLMPRDVETGLCELRTMPVVVSTVTQQVIGVAVPRLHVGVPNDFADVDNWQGLGQVSVVGGAVHPVPEDEPLAAVSLTLRVPKHSVVQ